MNKKPWFGPKRWGWGFSPKSWQGWAILAAIIVAIILLHELLVAVT